MINVADLRTLVIEPTLSKLQIYSKALEDLLVITSLDETNLGSRLMQFSPIRLGIYGVTPKQHADLWTGYIRQHNRMATLMAIHFGCTKIPDQERMIADLQYATTITSLLYTQTGHTLPKEPSAQAELYNETYARGMTPTGIDALVASYYAVCPEAKVELTDHDSNLIEPKQAAKRARGAK